MSEPFPAECLYLTGPTAAGKSAVALELAKLVGAEILALDSMTLYRGMDVGTAKPSADERAAVPHHLVDLLDPHEDFSQADYARAARQAVDEVLARGKTPLFVGGTPLYLKTLLRGMFEGPAADPELRQRLADEARTHPPGELHRRLAEVDRAAAKKLHPNDERRLIRALEVFQLTGTPISVHQRQFERPRPEAIGRVFVLDWPREVLYRRIDERVDAMVAAGLLDEVRRLANGPQELSRTARQALGYRETLEHLAGESDWPSTVAAVKTHTRQFAKRQLTWFRSLEECRPIAVTESDAPRSIAQRIYATIHKSG